MKKLIVQKHSVRVVLSALILCASSQVQAALVTFDWSNVGDGLITLDEQTGLKWLDLTVTQNRNLNEVWNQTRVTSLFDGFRLASGAEVLTLFKNSGVSWPSSQDDGDPATLKAFASYWSVNKPVDRIAQSNQLGATFSSSSSSSSRGYYDAGQLATISSASQGVGSKYERYRRRDTSHRTRHISPWSTRQVFRTADSFDPTATTPSPRIPTFSDPLQGYWMVQNSSAVPEPSTFVTLLGLLSFGWVGIGRSRTRIKAA